MAEIDWHIEIASARVENVRRRVELLECYRRDARQAARELGQSIAVLQFWRAQRGREAHLDALLGAGDVDVPGSRRSRQ